MYSNELGNDDRSCVWLQAMRHRKLICPALSPDVPLPALQQDPVPAPRTFPPIAETLWVRCHCCSLCCTPRLHAMWLNSGHAPS